MDTIVTSLAMILRIEKEDLQFNILEIGAVPLGEAERFHTIPNLFPSSQIIGFELDPKLCQELNDTAPKGFQFYAQAIGEKAEQRPLYHTNHPMCSSLYKPNDRLNSLYNGLEVAYLKEVDSVETVSLDSFCQTYNFDTIDFIKIDIQGAELDVFKGAKETLSSTLMIISEVEFIEIYENQPLFGDVTAYLKEEGFMYHKLLDFAGRTLRPLILKGDPNYPSQHMWSDAVYIPDIQKHNELSDEQLLKMIFLSYLYNSCDVAYYYAEKYDKRTGKSLCSKIVSLINKGS